MDNCKKLITTRCCLGPTGPTGSTGLAETIRVRSTVTSNPGEDANVIDTKDNLTHLLDFVIPRGPTGPTGNSIMRSAYLVSFNGNPTDTGVAVLSEGRLPIDREELDISDIITLNSTENTIQFNVTGYYKISIIISGYADGDDGSFDPKKDFISIGFRLVGTDDVFVGTSEWVYTNDPIQIKAEGIISVVDISNVYEIVNLSPSKLYLNTPDLRYIKSESYFTNALVTIIIDYLGRQGA